MKFFTSDLHAYHKFIATFRGFNDVEQMNNSIIRSINNYVRAEDELYIIGDLSFGNVENTSEFLNQIHCKSKYLILGNHDNVKRISKLLDHFIWVKDRYLLKIKDSDEDTDNQKLFLDHYPMLTWPEAHHGTWQVHGHSHGSLDSEYTSTRIDVGWDVWRRPIAYEDIKRYMLSKSYKIVDHHGEKNE
jgi:calcineurin-like phosphoesterase family protein